MDEVFDSRDKIQGHFHQQSRFPQFACPGDDILSEDSNDARGVDNVERKGNVPILDAKYAPRTSFDECTRKAL